MVKRTVKDVNWTGKCALVRVDFNLPFYPGSISISDDTRIKAVLPTLEHLRSRGASIVLCTHLGRPNKKVESPLKLNVCGYQIEIEETC